MSLTFHPKPGTVLMCDFSVGFTAPEMVKIRPVVVISPKRKRCSGLCTVVAISTVSPSAVENWHYQIPKTCMPSAQRFQINDSWVKGDMIYRVSFSRLNLIKLGKEPNSGKRLYFKQTLDQHQMKQIYSCVLHALNLGHLPQYL
ncbi:type II toxin-antitoxin system PemK/MazF family toxin [Spongiibacter sp. KMU-158]|uniref:Type II toxin-antitoxin system PemK/MazF family toxin n=1 Tax=Spongiibacter pelagi TaxID=2760804 RepID=A0A927BZK7_9GAMM|nr:type II toxin-antitoxin system PemK/MazF family toxin [Spongiibacter pelagi]MBD2857453.1 type II toxin-antitoxin system PemK/MazF family toxin [Spongiibacter pelagi]